MQVDVGRIIELAPAELAERDDREAARLGASGVRSAIAAASARSSDAVGELGKRAVTCSSGSSPARSPMPSASAIAASLAPHRGHRRRLVPARAPRPSAASRSPAASAAATSGQPLELEAQEGRAAPARGPAPR